MVTGFSASVAQEATVPTWGVTSSMALEETCPLLYLGAFTLLGRDRAGPVFTLNILRRLNSSFEDKIVAFTSVRTLLNQK